MIFLILLAVPMIIGLVAEYAACRFPKRRLWRWAPPLLTLLGTLAVTLYRYHGWSDGAEKAPWETLLFIPGIPALGAFLGRLHPPRPRPVRRPGPADGADHMGRKGPGLF